MIAVIIHSLHRHTLRALIFISISKYFILNEEKYKKTAIRLQRLIQISFQSWFATATSTANLRA